MEREREKRQKVLGMQITNHGSLFPKIYGRNYVHPLWVFFSKIIFEKEFDNNVIGRRIIG